MLHGLSSSILYTVDIVLRVLMKERPRDTLTFVKSANSSGSLVDQPLETDIEMEDLKPSQVSVNTPLPDSQPDPTPTTPSPKIGRLLGILALLRQPRLLAALYGILINETLIASLCATLPLFVDRTFHWTALPAGLLFLCIAIPTFTGPLAGALSDRFRSRRVAVTGFILTAPTVILLRLVKQDSLEHKTPLCVLLTLAGTTLTLFLPPLVAEETSRSIGCDLYASSFNLMNCSLASAGLLGPLAAGKLVNKVGWKWMTVVLGAFCATGIVPCGLLTGNQRVVKEVEKKDGNSNSSA
jgi:hypothetical protein